LGSLQVASGQATPGEIMSFLGALMLAFQPMRGLANLNASLQQGLAAAQRVFEVIDVEPSIGERPDAVPLKPGPGGIRFSGVTFAYAPDKPVLRGLDLDVPAGKRVALVGPSGAGKTTIFNLLMRLYEPSGGMIEVDGQDIRSLTMGSLRQSIALVSQEATVFNDTVLGNIAFADPNPDRDRAMAAAQAAEAHEFIAALENGYNTQLGEMGNRLSGGQRQRLAIARAIYKNAPILLLDEATSALDTETEEQVRTALERLMEGRTVLMIAHRLSTIVGADILNVLESGQLVETGRHEDLVNQGGLYARLHRVA
jgi:subfamily B ATP-binding cassette protein MsbA